MEKIFLEAIFIALLLGIILSRLFSKDKSEIWNPLVFIAIYLIYYVLLPVIKQQSVFGYDWSREMPGYLLAAIVSLVSILLGFKIRADRTFFVHSNSIFENLNKFKIGIALCAIAFVSYGMVKGFSINLFINEPIEVVFNEEGSYNNPKAYIEYLVSLFCIGCPILLVAAKSRKRGWLFFGIGLAIAIILYAISGFRYRILILAASLITTFYLFPHPKKINYCVIGTLALMIFIGMAVIERTRTYGRGLDFSRIENQDILKMEAGESDFVSSFSAQVIDRYSIDDYIYFEPIITAVTMPIPRAIFPEKPKGIYTREANIKIYNTITYGNALIYFAEAYISFGWLGIIVQGLFIGLVCKIFWSNYKRHTHSLGSVILLAVFNGFCFVWISRGYLAQAFTTYMYFLIIPFWIIRLLAKFKYFKLHA